MYPLLCQQHFLSCGASTHVPLEPPVLVPVGLSNPLTWVVYSCHNIYFCASRPCTTEWSIHEEIFPCAMWRTQV